MPIRIVAAVIAVALLLVYVAPMVFKLKDLALGIVIVVGVVLMLVDLWHSLRSEED